MKLKGEKLGVFAISESSDGGTFWARIGTAVVNKDGSLTVELVAAPLSGKLHIREVCKE